jgi:peroxiredoxin Q/BCP
MITSSLLRLLAAISLASLIALGADHSHTNTTPSNFSVTAPLTGDSFQLSKARGKFVALHFLLKTECPICLRHTREHFRKASENPDVVHIFLKPDSEAEIKEWAAKVGDDTAKGPVIHRDPDAALAKSFGIPDGYQFHGQSVHYPAFILINPEGREVFRHVGKNNSDRFSATQLTAKLRELAK